MHGQPRFVSVCTTRAEGIRLTRRVGGADLSPTGEAGAPGLSAERVPELLAVATSDRATNALLDVSQPRDDVSADRQLLHTGSWTRYARLVLDHEPELRGGITTQHPAPIGYYIMDECVRFADRRDGGAPGPAQEAGTPRGSRSLRTWRLATRTPPSGSTRRTSWARTRTRCTAPSRPWATRHFVVADFVSKLRAVAKPNVGLVGAAVLQVHEQLADADVRRAAAHAVIVDREGRRQFLVGRRGRTVCAGSTRATVSTSMSHLKTLTTELAGLEPALVAEPSGALVGNSTKFANPVAGRITQLQHNIAVEWLYSRKQWYQEELAALQAGDTSKSGGLINGAANVRTLTKVVDGVGYVFAYNYTNSPQPVTFTWQSAPTSVTESKTGQTFPLSGSAWTDTFGPYQARIHVVNGAGSAGPPPPPPTGSALGLSFTNPASGATVSETVTVTLSATGGTGYSFNVTVGGTPVYSGTNPSFRWNTTAVANARADAGGDVTDSQSRTATASRSVTVSNVESTPPPAPSITVSFTYPATGATVSGSQRIGLSTTAAWGQAKTFTLSVDGTPLTSKSETGTTFWYTWNTATIGNGSRTITATVAMDGQTATATVPVTVNNSTSTTPPPVPGPAPTPGSFTVSFAYPGAGATVSGAQTVGLSTTAAWGQVKTFTLSVSGTVLANGSVLTSQSSTGTTFWYSWDTTKVSNGSRTITAAVTMNGQTATATRAVIVSNNAPTLKLGVGSSGVPGETSSLTATIGNPGDATLVDVYLGVLIPPEAGPGLGCPQGDAIAFAAEGSSSLVVRCASSSPATFPRFATGASIPAGLPPTSVPDFFGLRWSPINRFSPRLQWSSARRVPLMTVSSTKRTSSPSPPNPSTYDESSTTWGAYPRSPKPPTLGAPRETRGAPRDGYLLVIATTAREVA